jgi:universal stress protein A
MTAINLASRHRSRARPKLAVRNILVPVDFSPASHNAWNYAVRFAQKFRAQLTLLHVVSPTPVLDVSGISVAAFGSTFDSGEAERNLRALAGNASGNSASTEIKWKAIPGIPSHDIVEYAKNNGADLIIMATHGYTGWKHFCIGSTAERVVRAAPCPVLVVREKEYEFA